MTRLIKQFKIVRVNQILSSIPELLGVEVFSDRKTNKKSLKKYHLKTLKNCNVVCIHCKGPLGVDSNKITAFDDKENKNFF